MTKLLSANFSRLIHSKFFWIGIIFSFVFPIYTISDMYIGMLDFPNYPMPSADLVWFNGATNIGIVITIFVSLWIGIDYSSGFIRNKLIVGNTRASVYFANWISVTIASAIMYLTYMATTIVFSILMLSSFNKNITVLSISFINGFIAVVALASLILMIIMLVNNKMIGTVVAMLIVFSLLLIIPNIFVELDIPEYISAGHTIDENGNIIAEKFLPNPEYLSGIKRSIYKFIIDFTPIGQLYQYHREVSNINNYTTYLPDGNSYFPVYSLILILISNLFGYLFFSRKNLK